MSVRFEPNRPGPPPRGPSQLLSAAAHVLVGAAAVVVPVLTPAALPEPATPRVGSIAPFDPPRVTVTSPREPDTREAVPSPRPAAGPAETAAGPVPIASPRALAGWADRLLGGPDPTGAALDAGGGGAGVPGGMPGGLPTGDPAATPGTTSGPLRAGGAVQRPVRISGSPPRYPELARRIRLEGDVVISCTVDSGGVVRDARVISGPALLHRAALDAIVRWRYAPTRLNGRAVAVSLQVVVRFELSE